MTNKTFLEHFNAHYSKDRRELIMEFFITFSRFECALKASGFGRDNRGHAEPDWDRFATSIRDAFDYRRTKSLQNAVVYIEEHPPKIQVIENGDRVVWQVKKFSDQDHLALRSSLSIRRIRNNLFHGGKFNGHREDEISRNVILLNAALVILNEWLDLAPVVRQHFLEALPHE